MAFTLELLWSGLSSRRHTSLRLFIGGVPEVVSTCVNGKEIVYMLLPNSRESVVTRSLLASTAGYYST